MKLLQRTLLYAMGGVFTEIIFTSLKTVYTHQDFALQGNTQLWVTLIYALGGLLFEQVYRKVHYKSGRVAVYVLLIYILEYSAGWILVQLLGKCPWHYYEPGNIHGLVQINYLPMWTLFAIIADIGVYYALCYELILTS